MVCPEGRSVTLYCVPSTTQDIYSLFHLQRPFKFISKTSNFYIPIIGWSMFLTGAAPQPHLRRHSRRTAGLSIRDPRAQHLWGRACS
jgi:hypothetical protein